MENFIPELYDWLAYEFSMDHLFVGFWEFLDAFDHHITTLHVQSSHLHEDFDPLIEILIKIQNSLHLDTFTHNILKVSDSFLGTPVVICGCGTTHDDLAVVSHDIKEGTQHVLTNIFVIDITLLSIHHLSDGLLELPGPDILSIIEFFVVETSLAAKIFGDLTFLISASNTIDSFITHFGKILGNSQTNSSSN